MYKIYVGFSKPKKFNLVSKLIQCFEKTNFSHVYLAWYSENLGRRLVYEARWGGVRFVSPKTFEQQNDIVAEFAFNVSREQKDFLIKWAIDNLGIKYSTWQLLGFLFIKFFKIFRKNIKNPFGDKQKGYVCSELAVTALKELNVLYGSDSIYDLDSLSPKDLFLMLKNIFETTRLSL